MPPKFGHVLPALCLCRLIELSLKKNGNVMKKSDIRERNKFVIPGVCYLFSAVIMIILAACNSTETQTEPPPYDGPVGRVTHCQTAPHFVSEMGVSPAALLGTTIPDVMGIAIWDPNMPDGGVIQHESWDDAGFLGPYEYDAAGNIYTAAVPYVSLDNNPPADQNKVYKIDTDTAEMDLLIDVLAVSLPTATNPFGVLGLAYDCDTNSLYSSSVAGSTPDKENGRISRINLVTGDIESQLEDIDAIGIGVFNSSTGKRLYYGRARAGVVYSILLDSVGNFVGDPRREFSLVDLGLNTTDKIRRITFPSDSEMQMKGVDFNYNPVVSGDAEQTIYNLRYIPDEDKWELVDVVLPEEEEEG